MSTCVNLRGLPHIFIGSHRAISLVQTMGASAYLMFSRFQYVSEKFSRLYQIRPNALVGLHLRSAMGHFSWNQHQSFMRAAMQGHYACHYIVDRVGNRFHKRLAVYIPHIVAASVIGFFLVLYDYGECACPEDRQLSFNPTRAT